MPELALGNRGFRRRVPSLRRAAWAFGLMLSAACAPAVAASGKCKLAKFTEFPIMMNESFYAEVSATRALLLFRLGDYDKSIADYDASLKIAPKNASALYGRGMGKLRKQKAPEGHADIAQAIELSPKIAESFNLLGIAP